MNWAVRVDDGKYRSIELTEGSPPMLKPIVARARTDQHSTKFLARVQGRQLLLHKRVAGADLTLQDVLNLEPARHNMFNS